jgi:hypothetical protein
MKIEDIVFLTNNTLDGDNEELVRAAGLPMGIEGDETYPLTQEELAILGEDGNEVPGIENADLLLGHSAIVDGVKYAASVIEFHFRNDKTRGMWGTPATLEEDLPGRGFQADQMKRVHKQLKEKPPWCQSVMVNAKDYIDTDDRYALFILIRFDWLLETAKITTYDQYLAFMKGLLQ